MLSTIIVIVISLFGFASSGVTEFADDSSTGEARTAAPTSERGRTLADYNIQKE